MGGREGGQARGGGPFFYSSSQQLCEKVGKIDDNVFFFRSRGTDCRYTYSQVLFLGHRLARSCLLLLLLFFFFFFQKCCRRRRCCCCRRRRRRTPSPPVKYLPTLGYLTCRVADFTTLGTLVTYETTNEHDECWIADLGHITMHPECEGVVCVCVYVCVSDWYLG